MNTRNYALGLILGASMFVPQAGAALKETGIQITCSYLDELGMRTRGWTNFYDSEYGCSSSYKQFGSGFPLKNNLAYYVDGGPRKAKTLKLVLNVNNKAEAKAAHAEMLKAAATLFKKAVAVDLPESIKIAIKKGTNAKKTVNDVSVELIRIDWPTGKGYELKLFVE